MTLTYHEKLVPVFSLTDLEKGLYSLELEECIKNLGVFYVTNSGVDEAQHSLLKDCTLSFFDTANSETLETLKCSVPGTRRGFSNLESESTAKITNNGSYTDYSMCYSMGVDNNIFPNKKFENTWKNYFDIMFEASLKIGNIVLSTSNKISNEKYLISKEFPNCEPVLRFRYFPEIPASRISELEPLRMAPHYDVSLITLIHQTPCENGFVSLECNINGNYVPLPPIPNAIIVLCGAVATISTNGKIKAPIHRVASPPSNLRMGSSRTSSVFFLRPHNSFKFSPAIARELGINVTIPGDSTTFGNWMGGNYTNLSSSKRLS